MDQAEHDGLAQAATATGEGAEGERGTSTYVVQRAFEYEPDKPAKLWEDLGIVVVPQRTQRRTVIAKALEEFAIPENAHPSLFRALSEDAGEEIPVRMETPPSPTPEPVLKVG